MIVIYVMSTILIMLECIDVGLVGMVEVNCACFLIILCRNQCITCCAKKTHPNINLLSRSDVYGIKNPVHN